MASGGSVSGWRRPRVALTLLLVFLAGSAAGALGMRIAMLARATQAGPAWTEGGKEVSLQMFRRELDLTEHQAAEVETVLDDFMMYYQTLQAQMDEVRANGKERILRILSEEQRARFTKMMGELQSRQIR